MKKKNQPTLIRTVFRSVFRWARSSGGAWRAYHPGQRERQEDPKAPINLFIVANPTIGTTLSKDTIFGFARKGRTGSQSWYHTNSGRATHNHFLSTNFHVQGVSFRNGLYELALTDIDMKVRFGLKMVLECWDREFLGTTTIFQKN